MSKYQAQAQAQVQNREPFKVLDKSKELAKKVYNITRLLPSEERYGLINQMRRSAISVASNIAEGRERKTKDNINFIRIARGSLYELQVQLEITMETYSNTFIVCKDALELLDEIGKMTYGLSRSLSLRTEK